MSFYEKGWGQSPVYICISSIILIAFCVHRLVHGKTFHHLMLKLSDLGNSE